MVFRLRLYQRKNATLRPSFLFQAPKGGIFPLYFVPSSFVPRVNSTFSDLVNNGPNEAREARPTATRSRILLILKHIDALRILMMMMMRERWVLLILMRERWVLLKRPRSDIDGVGEGK